MITFLPVVVTIGGTGNPQVILRVHELVKSSYFLHQAMYTAFTLFFWVMARTFGSISPCDVNSSAKVFIFWHYIAITNKWLRIAAITCASSMFGFTLMVLATPVAWKIIPFLNFPKALKTPRNISTFQRRAVHALLLVFCWVYWIVTIERTLIENGFASVSNQWSLGQTLSMALMFGTIVEFILSVSSRESWLSLTARPISVRTLSHSQTLWGRKVNDFLAGFLQRLVLSLDIANLRSTRRTWCYWLMTPLYHGVAYGGLSIQQYQCLFTVGSK